MNFTNNVTLEYNNWFNMGSRAVFGDPFGNYEHATSKYYPASCNSQMSPPSPRLKTISFVVQNETEKFITYY